MIDSFLKYINRCFQDVPTRVWVWLLAVFFMGMFLLFMFLDFKKRLRCFTGLLLLGCLFLLIVLAVLSRPLQAERTFDFIPFWSYRAIRDGGEELLTQIIANVVAFIPIGLLFGVSFSNIKWWKVLLIGGAFSLLIETLQFFLKRGFAEFDDVWHNVVGVMIGYGIYVGVSCLVKRLSKKATT